MPKLYDVRITRHNSGEIVWDGLVCSQCCYEATMENPKLCVIKIREETCLAAELPREEESLVCECGCEIFRE